MTTKHQLIQALFAGEVLTVTACNKAVTFRLVNAVEVESGCRHSFNVTGYIVSDDPKNPIQTATVCVRTID
jgi:hypothetical protein